MKKINTAPLSGMQELLPDAQVNFNNLKNIIRDTYESHGFLSIETPMIDRTEILLAKAGGDTEKQIYKVFKTAENGENADQALRFDHTVPLARYVVEHENDLVFPFKVAQIGQNFRGERAQKGRFREFYQCDVDVVGRDNLPLFYDADVISTLLDTYKKFGLKTSVVARISNRKILSGLIEEFGLTVKADDIFSIIDHSEKVPTEKTEGAFDEIGLTTDQKNKMMDFININGSRDEAAEKLKLLGIKNECFSLGVKELIDVLRMLEADGYENSIKADMKIVRGLDYYTGTVFEFNFPEYSQVGSVGGGGRYENLAGFFTDQKLPGVGGSIGLSRLFYVLAENNLMKSQIEKPIDVAVVPITEGENDYAMKVAKGLREEGKKTTIIATDRKLGDKLKTASKIAKSAIVLGENEVATGNYQVKVFE